MELKPEFTAFLTGGLLLRSIYGCGPHYSDCTSAQKGKQNSEGAQMKVLITHSFAFK